MALQDDQLLLLVLVFYHFWVLTPAIFIYGMYFYVVYSFVLRRAMQ